MDLNELSYKIIGAAIEVHRHLGPGLLESVYETCLERELICLGLRVEKQVSLPVTYKGEIVDAEGYRVDLMVADEVLIELKSVDKVKNVHKKQLLTYLKLSGKSLGLLINFNEQNLKEGVSRIVRGFDDSLWEVPR